MMYKTIMILIAALAVVLGGMFSGAETGMYQLSRLRLRLGIEKRRLRFVILGKAMKDSGGLLFSLLVGTNLANYVASSIVTLLLLATVTQSHTAELFATLITAPTLFVFSELIPKNVFYYRADRLMPFFSPLLLFFHRLFTYCGVVPLLKGFSKLFAGITGTTALEATSRSEIRSSYIEGLFHETRDEALLSPVQTEMISRIVGFPNMRLQTLMTPMSRVRMISADSDRAALLAVLRESKRTRLVVYRRSQSEILGFVNIYECLGSQQQFDSLDEFIKPVRRLSSQVTIAEAMTIMQKDNERMVLVTRTTHGKSRPAGIVTMKDLVEELLGELTEW